MGITNVTATLTNIDNPGKQADGEFLVDTGAGYTVVPYRMHKLLKLIPHKKQTFSLADGTTVKRDLSYAMIEIDGQKAPSTVVLGQRGDNALLGVVTLENMGLMVDPFKRTLRPMKLLLA